MGSVGFLVTKSPSELGFRTFLDLVGIWREDELTVYLISSGVYAAMKKTGIPTPSENCQRPRLFLQGRKI